MMNDELYHYGIKGQKWGVRRRSEDSDGSRKKYSKRKLAVGALGGVAIAVGGKKAVTGIRRTAGKRRVKKALNSGKIESLFVQKVPNTRAIYSYTDPKTKIRGTKTINYVNGSVKAYDTYVDLKPKKHKVLKNKSKSR